MTGQLFELGYELQLHFYTMLNGSIDLNCRDLLLLSRGLVQHVITTILKSRIAHWAALDHLFIDSMMYIDIWLCSEREYKVDRILILLRSLIAYLSQERLADAPRRRNMIRLTRGNADCGV